MNTLVPAQLIALGVGGLPGMGPGIAGFTAWFVAAAVLVLLAGLAWWTARPAKRASEDPDGELPTPRDR